MKKEIIIAIIVGIFLGLIITYGFYTSRTVAENQAQTQVNETQLEENDQEINLNQLSLYEPTDGLVISEKKIAISGASLKKNFVVIFVGNDDLITQADDSGNFSVEATLQPGANIITAIALDENGQQSQVSRTVIVDDASLNLATKEATDSASTSAETNKQADQEASTNKQDEENT